MKTFYYLVVMQCLLSFAWCGVFFEESFSDLDAYSNSPNAKVLADSLDYKFYEEKDHRLQIKDHKEGVVYKLDETIADGSTHKTLYISFCFRILSETAKDKFSGLVLYDDGREVFGVGNDFTSENYSFWTSDGKGIPIGEIPTPVDKDVHLIIMRIDFDPAGPEKIRVGLDPFCLRSESRQPDHIWTLFESQLSFNEIRLRSGNNECLCEFDEIRVGTDWTSVTPSNNQPGQYISRVIQGTAAAGKAEMIGDQIARFLPSGAEESKIVPSFVLQQPRQSIGTVSNSWQVRPRFGTLQGKRYVYLDIPAEVDLYGTGEVTGSLLRNGYKIVLFNKDNYGYGKPDQLYQSHPWVLGVREDGSAFGVIFDTTWISELDLRSGILFSTSRDAQDFPVIIIEGQNPQQVLTKLAQLTGTMPMPPRWALGYQQCRYSYNPDARVREIADTFRTKRIPCDVIWLDIDYMNGFRIFTFDPNQFPDPKATNSYLHSLGFKTVWMIDPGVKHEPGYFVYDSGTQADVWVKTAAGEPFIGPVWPGNCVFPDFTSPAVRLWWGALYKEFLAMGIDGIWNDMNEPAVFDGKTGWTMPLDNRHRGGDGLPEGPHAQYHNVYGLLMVKASREGIQKANPDKRPFVLSRANFLGGHRYAATWTGDNKSTWQHMKWSIPMSLNLSLSGQPFNGPDIGGFSENATPQLWAHWISVGAFYPFSRAHKSKDTENQEPWALGAETESAARIALQRRYRLMPYLYTLFMESHLTGLPVMRPLFFADAKDISLRMEDQAFLLGQDLMVIPKWAVDPRLPDETWPSISLVGEDARTDAYQCELRVRPGAVVPLGPVIQTTEQIVPQLPLTLVIVLDKQGQARGTLYEDAGDGYGYKNDQFSLIGFAAQKKDNTVTVKCVSQKGIQTFDKRLVTAVLVDQDGVRYGFGDIVSGVSIKLDVPAQNSAETTLLW